MKNSTQKELLTVLLNSKQIERCEKWLEQYEYDLKDEAITDVSYIVAHPYLHIFDSSMYELLRDAQRNEQPATSQAVLERDFGRDQPAAMVPDLFPTSQQVDFEADCFIVGEIEERVEGQGD
ncbi:hypothetical protein V1525DRAFT_389329 [Lipomyces kononenkoae]|uniref:Uncharacterized protein n=1 Tax=Lipomyces kononenkoae TaxID=34357 RepID=A0ACC3SY87_LIPKO